MIHWKGLKDSSNLDFIRIIYLLKPDVYRQKNEMFGHFWIK